MIRSILVSTCLLLGTTGALAAAQDCVRGRDLFLEARDAASDPGRQWLLERSLSHCKDPGAYYQLALVHLRAARLQDAKMALVEARAAAADDLPRLGLIDGRLAQVYLAQDRIGEALAYVDSATDMLASQSPPWLAELRRQIDLHPGRQHMSRETLARALATRRTTIASRGFAAAPKVDVYVSFDFDRDMPNAEGMLQLREMGAALLEVADPAHSILLIGHTDLQGDAAYNQGLSERRSGSVARLLAADHPVLADRLWTEGRGETEPRYWGNTDEDHRLNRRVEVRLVAR